MSTLVQSRIVCSRPRSHFGTITYRVLKARKPPDHEGTLQLLQYCEVVLGNNPHGFQLNNATATVKNALAAIKTLAVTADTYMTSRRTRMTMTQDTKKGDMSFASSLRG